MNTQQHTSRQLAGLIGPTLVAVVAAELPFVQPHLYDQQTPVGVYGSGMLMFVAGLAILRAHHHWAANWTVLVTLTGWGALLLGLVRMFTASGYRNVSAGVDNGVWVVLESGLILAGAVLTYHAYFGRRPSEASPDGGQP